MKLRSGGRGRGYSARRGVVEAALRVAYRGDWPARAWSAVPGATVPSTTRLRVELPPGPGRPCRVGFVSDLHLGPTTPVALVERAFELLERERPDVLLLGGDYVFLEAEPRRLAALGALVEAVGCPTRLAVLGNHDLWTDDRTIVAALSKAGARVLVNDAAALPAPWSDVVVLGLDDPLTGVCDPTAAAAGTRSESFRIVLCHGPGALERLGPVRFDLFLAGHTHGGQIATPWGPIVLPRGRMCRLFPSGAGTFGAGRVYVTRGVGGVELPVRAFAPPEVVLLELHRP